MNTTGADRSVPQDIKPGQRLGDLLRARRLELGLTQKQVEARSGGVLSQNYISQIERGVVSLPSFEMLGAFAETLALRLNDLKIAAGYPVVHEVAGDIVLGLGINSGVEVGTRVRPVAEPSHEQLRQFWLLMKQKLPPDQMAAILEEIEEIAESLEEADQEDK